MGEHRSPAWSLAARKVSIRRPLADVETFEKETATFLLELSHASVPGVWARGGVRVKPSGTCRISATGCTHSLTLEGLTLQDSGTITFTTDTLRCSARLIVRGTALGDTGTQRCLSSSWGGGSAQQGHSGHTVARGELAHSGAWKPCDEIPMHRSTSLHPKAKTFLPWSSPPRVLSPQSLPSPC